MNLKGNKGFTLVELLVAMLLMGILGTLVMKFMISASTFNKKVYTDYNAKNEARSAVQYISSRIRQNDAIGAIDVKNNKIIITIKDDKGAEKEVDTICYDGIDKKLYDVSEISGKSSKKKISDSSSFEVKIDANAIVMIIGYVDSSEVEKKYTETITLRSYN